MNSTSEQGRIHIPLPHINGHVTAQGKRMTIVVYGKKPVMVLLSTRLGSITAIQLSFKAQLFFDLSLLRFYSSGEALCYFYSMNGKLTASDQCTANRSG